METWIHNADEKTYTQEDDLVGQRKLFMRIWKRIYAAWSCLIGYPSVIYTNTRHKRMKPYKKVKVIYYY